MLRGSTESSHMIAPYTIRVYTRINVTFLVTTLTASMLPLYHRDIFAGDKIFFQDNQRRNIPLVTGSWADKSVYVHTKVTVTLVFPWILSPRN